MMIERETLEWTQTWWQQAERDDLPRVLTIGDSILCGYRERVQQELAGKVYVDQFATSKFAADLFLRRSWRSTPKPTPTPASTSTTACMGSHSRRSGTRNAMSGRSGTCSPSARG